MKRIVAVSTAAVLAITGAAAVAVAQTAAPAAKAPAQTVDTSLKVGAKAPDFSGTAYIAGAPKPYSLKNELKKGPVVVYFFPAAFTGGCNLEAQEFAANIDAFQAQGATVLGLTAGFGQTARKATATTGEPGLDDAVRDFSAQHCAGKFPVAAASPALVHAFQAASATNPNRSGRISYLIAPNGTVAYSYNNALTGADAISHIPNTLAAAKAWRVKNPVRRG